MLVNYLQAAACVKKECLVTDAAVIAPIATTPPNTLTIIHFISLNHLA
jgi:hypothetical protein